MKEIEWVQHAAVKALDALDGYLANDGTKPIDDYARKAGLEKEYFDARMAVRALEEAASART